MRPNGNTWRLLYQIESTLAFLVAVRDSANETAISRRQNRRKSQLRWPQNRFSESFSVFGGQECHIPIANHGAVCRISNPHRDLCRVTLAASSVFFASQCDTFASICDRFASRCDTFASRCDRFAYVRYATQFRLTPDRLRFFDWTQSYGQTADLATSDARGIV